MTARATLCSDFRERSYQLVDLCTSHPRLPRFRVCVSRWASAGSSANPRWHDWDPAECRICKFGNKIAEDRR